MSLDICRYDFYSQTFYIPCLFLSQNKCIWPPGYWLIETKWHNAIPHLFICIWQVRHVNHFANFPMKSPSNTILLELMYFHNRILRKEHSSWMLWGNDYQERSYNEGEASGHEGEQLFFHLPFPICRNIIMVSLSNVVLIQGIHGRKIPLD